PVCARRGSTRTPARKLFSAVRSWRARAHRCCSFSFYFAWSHPQTGFPFFGSRTRRVGMDDAAKKRHLDAEEVGRRPPAPRSLSVVAAFATVPREKLLGEGPWQIISFNRVDQPFITPDAAAHWVYHDVLVALDPARQLNNGAPSFWAHNLDHLDLR